MLRISILNEPGITRLKLEGKLAHEWVHEAETTWRALTAMKGSTEILVDLMGVSFVDESGCQLLAEMRHAGAELCGCGPLMSAVIEEIEDAEAATNDELVGDLAELVEDEKELEQ